MAKIFTNPFVKLALGVAAAALISGCGVLSSAPGFNQSEKQTLSDLDGAHYTPRSQKDREAILTQDLFAQAAFWSREYDLNPADLEAAINLTSALRRLGNAAKAVEIAQHTRAMYPRSTELMTELAASHISGEQPREAIKIADQALRQPLPNAGVHARILSIKGAGLDQLEDFRGARDLYTQALQISPDDPKILSNVGLSYALEGDPRTAEIWLRRAAILPTASASVRQNLSLVLGLQGKTEEAEHWAARDMSREAVQENTEYLNGLRGAGPRINSQTVGRSVAVRNQQSDVLSARSTRPMPRQQAGHPQQRRAENLAGAPRQDRRRGAQRRRGQYPSGNSAPQQYQPAQNFPPQNQSGQRQSSARPPVNMRPGVANPNPPATVHSQNKFYNTAPPTSHRQRMPAGAENRRAPQRRRGASQQHSAQPANTYTKAPMQPLQQAAPYHPPSQQYRSSGAQSPTQQNARSAHIPAGDLPVSTRPSVPQDMTPPPPPILLNRIQKRNQSKAELAVQQQAALYARAQAQYQAQQQAALRAQQAANGGQQQFNPLNSIPGASGFRPQPPQGFVPPPQNQSHPQGYAQGYPQNNPQAAQQQIGQPQGSNYPQGYSQAHPQYAPPPGYNGGYGNGSAPYPHNAPQGYQQQDGQNTGRGRSRSRRRG